MADAQKMGSGQFFGQMLNERDWEKARRPYYNMWPSIIPMLTRLNLDLDSDLIQLPLPALCIRFPKEAKNPLKFDWKGDEVAVRCIMLGEINQGTGPLGLVDIGEVDGRRRRADLHLPQLPPQAGPDRGKVPWRTWARRGLFAEIGIQVPDSLVMDCIRLCCSLCLLENDPAIISPDVLADDRAKFEASGDQKFVEKAHRRGKVGWDVGKHIEVIPHFRRPHMTLVWTGSGRAVPGLFPGGAVSCIGRLWRSCRVGLGEEYKTWQCPGSSLTG